MRESNMRTLVATINSKDMFFEADINVSEIWEASVLGKVKRIVFNAGFKTNRKNPQKIKINVDSISVKDGKQVRNYYKTFEIMPPLERMTEEEFQEEQKDILKEVPHEFHEVFISMAWDRGHSSGYEEVISYLKNLVYELSSPINAFARRVSKTI